MSFFASQTIRRRASVSTTVDAQLDSYENRLALQNRYLNPVGRAFIREIFQSAYDYGRTVSNGWAFGSAVNVSRNLQINLIANKPSITPIGTLNARTTASPGMLGVRTEGTGSDGYTTADGTGIFNADRDYSVMMLSTYTADPDGSAPFIFTQSNSPSFAGNIEAYGGATGGLQFIDRTSTGAGFEGGVNGGDNTHRENLIDPQQGWWRFNGSGQYEMIHASGLSSGLKTFAGNPGNKPLILANAPSSPYRGNVGFAALIRFDGPMDAATHQAIFDRILKKWNTIGWSIGIVGNSVTISGVSDPQRTWARQVQTQGVYSGWMVCRIAQGAQRLFKFAPLGYVQPGPPFDPDIASRPVNILEKYRCNLVVIDDQQNAIAAGCGWENWLHCSNAIIGYFAALNEPGRMRGVMCTQMAHAPYSYAPVCAPLSYAEIVASRARFRDISIQTRAASLPDFNNIPVAVADVYANENRGWTSDVDGTPADPINDYPRGNDSHFAYYPPYTPPNIDPQHWNEAGHDYHYTNTYLPAIQQAIAL